MPVPSSDQLNAILERLCAAATNGTREPTAILSAEEHRTMLQLHIHDPLSASVVLQQLREHARGLEGWSRSDIRDINFNMYVAGARQHFRRQEEIEAATNVVRISTRRAANTRRERNHVVQVDAAQGMSVAQMIETDSPFLIAHGLLRQRRGGRIWHDEFYKRPMTDWRGDDDGSMVEPHTINEEEVNRITRWLHSQDRRLNRMSMATVNNVIDGVANEDKRNEPRDWMALQQWDEVPRLAQVFARGFGAPDTEFNRQAGRCWFVSMAARVAEPGCKVDTMPVFIGPQGALKSQALDVIGDKWYRAASSSIDSKDFLQEMHGVLVMEIPELHSMLASRLGSAKIKAVLSTRVDSFRLPYGMRVSDHKRTCVCCGTTNNRDWHSDETGGRRFWPVHCGGIDLQWLQANRAQLFAEAYHYYQGRLEALRSGGDDGLPVGTDSMLELGKWWNVPEADQAELMAAETAVNPWQDQIAARLEHELARGAIYDGHSGQPTPWDGTTAETTDWGNLLTVTRIGVQWLGLSSDQLGRGRSAGKDISTIMRGLGWETARPRVQGMRDRPRAFVRSISNSQAAGTAVHAERAEASQVGMDQMDQMDHFDRDAIGLDDVPF